MHNKIRIYTRPEQIPGLEHGSAVTIGNFDGVHLGHQAIVRRAMAQGLPAVVMTFEPHPREFFDPARAPARLSSLREKAAALETLGLERLLCLPFRRQLAELSPEDFVSRILVQGLHARWVLVGHDFRFGGQRRGDLALLERLGARHGFQVTVTPPVCLDGERISSTGLRQHLAAGELARAERELGRPYAICGRVVHGDKRGRALGFPTANLPLYGRKPVMTGVFAVLAETSDGRRLPAVANLGTRPTVDGARAVLEVHVLDGAPDLYGQRLFVHFLCKIRAERRFSGLDELKNQIARDVQEARALFQSPALRQNHGL